MKSPENIPARVVAAAILVAVLPLLHACTEPSTGLRGEASLQLTLENLPPLEEGQGSYEAWVIGPEGTIRSAGRFEVDGDGSVSLTSPMGSPAHVMVTVEPDGDADSRPSEQKLIGGPVEGGSAELTIDRYLTAGVPLVEDPGTHTLFTPSDNRELGYPSNEDAGLWMYNVRGDTVDGDFYLRFSNLSRGWTYEGWVVRDHGTEQECWLSYGKFEPDAHGKLTREDDLGFGPYSGRIQYRLDPAEEIDFPGGDYVGNPHGFPPPCGLELPLDLNGDQNSGVESRWTHVITIEPETEEDEEDVGREPFVLRPYGNPVGEGYAGEPRDIQFYPEALPSGRATLGGGG